MAEMDDLKSFYGAGKLRAARLALLPVAGPEAASRCLAALKEDGVAFTEFLRSQDLLPLWHDCLQSGGLLASLPQQTENIFRQARREAAVSYLAQQVALQNLDRLFEAEGIGYAVMKGVQVRERVYSTPSARTCGDIDVLVSEEVKLTAARLLTELGYSVYISAENISHEVTFSKPPVDFDLHWNILRPGRTRVNVTRQLLERRQRVNGFWGLSESDTLFLMLTHPAFAKYVCSPNMGLSRVADFLLWIRQQQVDWSAVRFVLEQTGLNSAAWIMLSWVRILAPADEQNQIDAWRYTIRPGRMRARYLQAWLDHDLPTRWLNYPKRIQLGMTLFLHDRPADILHALRGWRRARRSASADVRSFEIALHKSLQRERY